MENDFENIRNLILKTKFDFKSRISRETIIHPDFDDEDYASIDFPLTDKASIKYQLVVECDKNKIDEDCYHGTNKANSDRYHWHCDCGYITVWVLYWSIISETFAMHFDDDDVNINGSSIDAIDYCMSYLGTDRNIKKNQLITALKADGVDDDQVALFLMKY